MTLSFLFWFLMLLWLLFGAWAYYPSWQTNHWGWGGSLLLFVLLCLLGWHSFGLPIRG